MTERRRGSRLRWLPVGLLFVTAVLLTLGSFGTFAYWTDSATVSSGNFKSGTLDITVGDSTTSNLAGPGGTWTYANLAMPLMVPGSTTGRQPVKVTNSGDVAVTLAGAVGITSGSSEALTGTAADGGLSVSIFTEANCSSGTALATVLPKLSATTFASGVSLEPGASVTYCVQVTFGANAPTSMQGITTSVDIAFTAAQVIP